MDPPVPQLTLLELEREILTGHRLLKSLPRSDPNRLAWRSAILTGLAKLQTQRWAISHQKSDYDKAITHLTEAVLLPQIQNIVVVLFQLASLLLSRFALSRQPDDVKSSLIYFRFLRIKFHSLEAFNIPHTSGDLASNLFEAIAHNFLLTPDDMVQAFEEMVPLIPEIVTSDTLTSDQKQAMKTFCRIVTQFSATMFRREDTQQVSNRTIQVLREATVLNPDLDISFALAMFLVARFEAALVMSDYEEAIVIANRIVATHSPGNIPTTMEINAMLLISVLSLSRMALSSRPDHLEDAIRRIRTFIPYLPDERRTTLANILDSLMQRRFDYFGVTGGSDGTPPQANSYIATRPTIVLGEESNAELRMTETGRRLTDVLITIINGEITDVEAAVERSRKSLPFQRSSDQWSSQASTELAKIFADILFEAYERTKNLDYLDEALTTFRDIHNMSARKVTWTRFNSGYKLCQSLLARLQLFHRQEDFKEVMQLFPKLANDGSKEVFDRVKISFYWAGFARINRHPSASMAYETAMSQLQETLAFCPTLQTQHLCLAQAFLEGGSLPSDYASYQIEGGQVRQAVETLEQGRALIWSEMRGLRTSTDQLRAANPALADKFVDINQRLESVTMSVARSDDDDLGHSKSGTESGEHAIGHLVLTQRRLLEDRNHLISHIQSLPGFEHFLKLTSFDFLNSASSHGPVIIVNQSRAEFPSHIILLLKDSPPSIISTPSGFHDCATRLEHDLLNVRKEKGPGSMEYDRTLAYVLAELYELVGKSVVEELRRLEVPRKSRVWWCPTGAFCSLPLHAMGPIPSDDGKDLYFSDLYIPSYTPTLSTLIESRKRGSLSDVSDNHKPSILLVAQPESLPGAFGEIKAIEVTKAPVKSLISAMATPETVIEGLRDHRFAHFVCHGLLETGKPFEASLELHKGNLTLLAIVRSQLPAAEFAFLSACHTAELTEGSLADEGLHLAAAMQYCGFRSVVGTMWAMADTDGADLSKHFYKAIFMDKADQNSVPYHERSARALHIAVKKLRKKRGMTLERWVNFVHFGA